MSKSKVQITADALMTLRSDPVLTSEAGFIDPHAPYFVTEDGRKMTEMIIDGMERIYVPYNLARFRFFMDELERSDHEQILFLGAGYDTRFLWMEKLKQGRVPVFEVDFDRTIRSKAERLKEVGIPIPSYVHSIPSDLANEFLPGLLGREGFDPGLRTLVVMEGVEFFLPAEVSETLILPGFLGLRHGSKFVFDFWTRTRVDHLNGLTLEKIGKKLFDTFESAVSIDSARAFFVNAGYRDVRIRKLDEIVESVYGRDLSTELSAGWLLGELIL